MLSESNIDSARRTNEELEKVISELQLHRNKLEVTNQALIRENEAMNEFREFYQRLYNLSPIGYFILDMEGVIQHVNPAAACLLDRSAEALLDKKMATFIHPSDQDIFYFFIHGVAAQQSSQGLKFRLKQAKKSPDYPQCPGIHLGECPIQFCSLEDRFTYVECRRIVYFDNNQVRIYLTVEDITEQKYVQESMGCLNRKLEEKLVKQISALIENNLSLKKEVEELEKSQYQFQEREIKLNAIFNAAAEGIITIDRCGIIISVNAAVEAIFGYSQEELIGCSINKIIPVSRSKDHNYPLKKSLQSLMPNVIGKMQNVDGVRKDGSCVSLELSVAEFSIDGAGYYTSLVRDVSLRKLKERQDKEHLDALAHVTRLGLMGEMASGIAHEVNQPLTAIVGYTMASLNFIQYENINKETLNAILHKTHDQAVRAGQIIQRMRDFVKPKVIHRSAVNINELIIESMSLCSSDLKNNNIVQDLDLIKNVSMVHVDSVQIEQVLINLIRNSLEALIRLPQTVRRLLTIQTYINKDQYLEIRIKDNGPGLTEEEQKKIFTPFYTTKSDGMGMGLSISQSIVRSHQGEMYFNSLLGKGTTFYFTLPTQRNSE